jgi:HAD superfamily hydrolase (TIGR01509 family)
VIHAVVFDFDGLLVDTETPTLESWLDIYREYGQDFPLSKWSMVLGGSGTAFDPAAYPAQRIGQPLAAEAIATRRRRRKEELAGVQPLMPGVAAYLDDAARLGLRLGVASSSSRAWVVGHLDRLGVAGCFDSMVTADDVARVKPAPDLCLAAVAALSVRPQEAIALEDAPNGLLAAKRAGLLAVAVPTPLTERFPLDDADLRITSLADVPLEALLEALRAATARVAADDAAGA